MRDVDVVLDADLARLYGIETKRPNEQIKRNAERFDGDFAFQPPKEDAEVLRSQIATANEEQAAAIAARSRGSSPSMAW